MSIGAAPREPPEYYPENIELLFIRVYMSAMIDQTPPPFVAFDGARRIASGSAAEVAVALRRAQDTGAAGPLLAFDSDGRPIDFDLRGAEAEILARHAPPPPEPRGRGRPKLGVAAREVTLLPRHWDWLARQPGGASVALRKLVEQARRVDETPQRTRQARDAAYRFMAAMAGDLEGFEEAIRALYADDRPRLEALTAAWPLDVRDHALGRVDQT